MDCYQTGISKFLHSSMLDGLKPGCMGSNMLMSLESDEQTQSVVDVEN